MTLLELEKERQRKIAEETVQRISRIRDGRIPMVESGEKDGYFWTGIKKKTSG